MSEQLLDLLKLCLLILLYLFFLRVMWAVFSELRTPIAVAAPEPANAAAAVAEAPTRGSGRASTRPGKRTSRGRSAPPVLRTSAPPELAGTDHVVVGEMTIGRAPGCSIVVDDTYASQLHARVFMDERGVPTLEDLGSTNGTFCNGEPVTGARPLRRGDRVQVGNTVWDLA